MKRHLFLLLAVAMLAPVPFVMAQGKTSLFKPSIIHVQKSTQNTQKQNWTTSPANIDKKIVEAEKLINDLTLKIGDEKINYTEKRVTSEGGKIKVVEQNFKDTEREIALVLMNQKTGKLTAIKIIKRGGQLISPAGYQIQVVERMNGIRWNQWATQYKVVSPKDTVVLLNKYPIDRGDGKVEYFTYSPYSSELENPAMIEDGAKYLHDIVAQAKADLRARGVKSQAVPGKLAADVLPDSYFQHLPFLEQSDLLEALSDSDWSIKRVLGTLGYNKSRAWIMSGNYAGAYGWVQFTDNWRKGRPGTYSTLVQMYPDAGLDPKFPNGAADHVNSMKAAILLYDTNLDLLVRKFGADVVKNPLLEEYLAASYNGAPSRVVKSLTSRGISGTASQSGWYEDLVPETEGYIAKLRLLNQKQVPQKFLD